MKLVRDVIHRLPVWVNPGHTAETATVLMKGHGIGSLPVLDGPRLVGFLMYTHLLGAPPETRVRELMMIGVPTVDCTTTIKDAADFMATTGMTRLPVLDSERLFGVVTDGDLLPELGRSFDPLTGLPWSDTMREWAIHQLSAGLEVTVLFFDIDNFGAFNKTHGHIVGDEVLRAVAKVAKEVSVEHTDSLCRYGGDEFCIATLRSAPEAAVLANKVTDGVSNIALPALNGAGISCTAGQAGGKRTREREHVHYAATLNNLINLASRNCTAHKPAHATIEDLTAVVRAAQRDYSRMRLGQVAVEWQGATANVTVDLQMSGVRKTQADAPQESLSLEGITYYPASASARTDSEGALRLVAETTLCALRGALPDGYEMTMTDLLVTQTTTGQSLITVVAEWVTPKDRASRAGTALVTNSPYRAAASAVLAAANRSVAPVIAQR